MSTAPDGAIVSLYVDLVSRVADGDIIQTGTGRRYHVLEVRVQQRGKHAGRQHLRCLVMSRGDKLAHATVHQIRWYSRDRKSA